MTITLQESASGWEQLCRHAEERAYEAEALSKGRCPWSGLRLTSDGEGLPGNLSCEMCDCFGFDPKEVWNAHIH